jgi:hypothetical protein
MAGAGEKAIQPGTPRFLAVAPPGIAALATFAPYPGAWLFFE